MFVSEKLSPEKMHLHTGGAIGSDSYFEKLAIANNFKVSAYSYRTKRHTSCNKVEITDEQYKEGRRMIIEANRIMKRSRIERYMNLLARNWFQVKNSVQVFAVGEIMFKGHRPSQMVDLVSGGTGYAHALSVISGTPFFIFDQKLESWYEWSFISERFIRIERPSITKTDFAGIGTRDLNPIGESEIKGLFNRLCLSSY